MAIKLINRGAMSQLYTTYSGRPVVKTPDGVERTLAFTSQIPSRHRLEGDAVEVPSIEGTFTQSCYPPNVLAMIWCSRLEGSGYRANQLAITTYGNVSLPQQKDMHRGVLFLKSV